VRVSLGDITRTSDGQYPLVSSIDPSVTYESCLPTMCGADPLNMAKKYQCSSNGYAGVKSCSAPECKPYCPNAQVAPAVTTAAISQKFPPVLTPQNVSNPMPSITEALQPQVPASSKCSLWCDLNGAIANNPLLSAAILLGAFLLLKGRR